MSGREILRREMKAGHQDMNLSAIETGTYLIEAVSEKENKILKFVKR